MIGDQQPCITDDETRCDAERAKARRAERVRALAALMTERERFYRSANTALKILGLAVAFYCLKVLLFR
jgi:hypothetical protein